MNGYKHRGEHPIGRRRGKELSLSAVDARCDQAGQARGAARPSGVEWGRAQAGFSLVEVMVAVSIVAVLFVTMYVGFSSGYGVVQVARENQRATQILLEKTETIRLYSWDQINTSGFIPATFSEPFYATNNTGTGIQYTGTVSIAAAPVTESYANDLRLVTVQISWISGKVPRSRTMSTFVSRYGLQNYVY